MNIEYLSIGLLLLTFLLLYFGVARRYNIIDRPNERSSHTQITLRGAGMIFFLGALLWFFRSGMMYAWFFIGLTIISVVSFLDDVFSLSNRPRLFAQMMAILCMMYQLGLYALPWYACIIALVLITGVINAYNFMDGINGITAAYSFSVLFLLWLINKQVAFIEEGLIIYVALSNLIFAFYNFRHKAKCFAGDVGSVSMSFLLIFLTVSLILKTGNYIYIMFFAVYGVDTILTIIHRLIRKENIFKAHRLHLYQCLANERKMNRLLISTMYAIVQLGIGLLIFYLHTYGLEVQFLASTFIIMTLSSIYFFLKRYILVMYAK